MEVIFLRNLDDLQTPLLLVWTLWLSMSVTAIHRAAGPQLRAACYEVSEVRPGVRCPLGEARITPWVYSVFFFFSCIIKWRLINEDVFLQTNGTGVLTCLHPVPLDLSMTQLSTLKNPSPILTGNRSFSCSTLIDLFLLDISRFIPLFACYRNSMRVAKENNIKYIAFPAISCGIYG